MDENTQKTLEAVATAIIPVLSAAIPGAPAGLIVSGLLQAGLSYAKAQGASDKELASLLAQELNAFLALPDPTPVDPAPLPPNLGGAS